MNLSWILLDGHLCQQNQALFSFTNREIRFGDGVFTTARVHNGKIEFLSKHFERLKEHAKFLKFHLPPFDFACFEKLIECNQATTGIWRLNILATRHEKNHSWHLGHLIVTLTRYLEDFSIPRSLSLFPTPCYRPLAHLKTLSHLDLLHIKEEALDRGYHDAIMQTEKGYLLETSSANLFWIDQNACWIPDLKLPYLKGIILKTLIDHLAMPLHFVKKTLEQIPSTAHVYLCNSLIHIQPVIIINQFSFKRNPKWESLLKNTLEKELLAASLLN